VQEHDDRAIRRALLVIGDIEDAGIDVTKRQQTARGGRARRCRGLARTIIGCARLTEFHGETS
jgi:hypothetical protein